MGRDRLRARLSGRLAATPPGAGVAPSIRPRLSAVEKYVRFDRKWKLTEWQKRLYVPQADMGHGFCRARFGLLLSLLDA
ncbi:hypothetical protein CF64_03825 [Bradyrhizobium japonicum]|nr:hypothetical protein CF64_03825 [Bradyrhizobium japonicum]